MDGHKRHKCSLLTALWVILWDGSTKLKFEFIMFNCEFSCVNDHTPMLQANLSVQISDKSRPSTPK